MQLLTYSPAVCLSADFNVSHVVSVILSLVCSGRGVTIKSRPGLNTPCRKFDVTSLWPYTVVCCFCVDDPCSISNRKLYNWSLRWRKFCNSLIKNVKCKIIHFTLINQMESQYRYSQYTQNCSIYSLPSQKVEKGHPSINI